MTATIGSGEDRTLDIHGAPRPLQQEPLPDLDAAPLAFVVDLVRRRHAVTRPTIAHAGRLGRKVVALRVEQAIDLGLLREGALAPSDGGRQARTLEFVDDAGVIYVAHIGVTHFRCGIVDLGGNIVAESAEDWPIERGPDATLTRVQHHFDELSRTSGRSEPWAICIGVPGPVDIKSGALVSPPVMPGWDRCNPRDWFQSTHDIPVWIDNDANLMALGEWSRTADAIDDMLFIKIGSSLGAGIIVDRKVLRGARGAAGDIGHTHVSNAPTARCRCGRTGCLDAIASGWALLDQAHARAESSTVLSRVLATQGHLTLADIGVAARAHDPVVIELLEHTSNAIAVVTANLVSFTNPSRVVIGGGVLQTGELAVDIIRQRVLELCTDIVTADLTITRSQFDPHHGIIGAGVLASDRLLSVPALSHWVAHGSPIGRGATIQTLAE